MAGAVEERAGLPVDGWVPPMHGRQNLVLDPAHGGFLFQLRVVMSQQVQGAVNGQ